jgi:hypothetical protein
LHSPKCQLLYERFLKPTHSLFYSAFGRRCNRHVILPAKQKKASLMPDCVRR